MNKNQGMTENIQVNIGNEADFLHKFNIQNDSNLIQRQIFNIKTTNDFIFLNLPNKKKKKKKYYFNKN